MGYTPVPATSQVISRYATFLARSLKFSSIKQYMNIIRLLHLEWDLPNPLCNNFVVQQTMRGNMTDITRYLFSVHFMQSG